ncbi:hypothetical protein L873DRAFT_1097817 [Choiromyces venosus 120613-1]|uniref:Uncharacterized protein n=1 Tax=Choiromyces venosus 120613-1 TaxID=1336337 RepID=A0A3N4JMG4_9PEZI|nr:hypothetical protein L873DRAFT_1097817 [Choiromyces venosus 120613-1]
MSPYKVTLLCLLPCPITWVSPFILLAFFSLVLINNKTTGYFFVLDISSMLISGDISDKMFSKLGIVIAFTIAGLDRQIYINPFYRLLCFCQAFTIYHTMASLPSQFSFDCSPIPSYGIEKITKKPLQPHLQPPPPTLWLYAGSATPG